METPIDRKQGRSGDALGRIPPADVKRQLRAEVNWGCPVLEGRQPRKCGLPMLEWHHFDPPWAVENHHRVDGMIALCTKHHPMADRGVWSKEQLRTFKQQRVPRDVVRETFAWSERNPLYRLASNYSAMNGGVLGVAGLPVLWDSRTDDGRTLLSLEMQAKDGASVVSVRDNSFDVKTSEIHDLEVSTSLQHFKVWLRERDIGLELKFDRVKPSSLGAPPGVVRFATENCLDSDGCVPLVAISRAKFWGNGRLVEIVGDRIKSTSVFTGCSAFGSGGFAWWL